MLIVTGKSHCCNDTFTDVLLLKIFKNIYSDIARVISLRIIVVLCCYLLELAFY